MIAKIVIVVSMGKIVINAKSAKNIRRYQVVMEKRKKIMQTTNMKKIVMKKDYTKH